MSVELDEKNQSVMVSVAVSKLSKTHLVFMQPGAKIYSVYYCDNVLQQGLLPGIRRLSNDDSLFQQYGAPAHRYVRLSLTCAPTCLS